MNVVSDFGEPGVPFLKCLARLFKTFEYQTDMLSHQAYWAGAAHQIQIQASDCRAEPLYARPTGNRVSSESMRGDVPGKVAAYGGIPKIGTFWRSELVCDFVTIVVVLITSGQALGVLFLLTPFGRIAKNHVIQMLQQRYFWVGRDGLMASKMLGLDPLRSDVYINDHAYTKCSLGTVLQLLSLSGPSSFVRLGGDDLLTVGGLSIEPPTFAFPVKRAIAWGLCENGRGVVNGASSTGPSTKIRTTQTRQRRGSFTGFAPVDESTDVRTQKSIFDRQLKLVVDGYTGVVRRACASTLCVMHSRRFLC